MITFPVPRMNYSIKQQWIRDLLSGNFPQTNTYLHDHRGYCCWGVLCEQAVHAGIVSTSRPVNSNAWNYQAAQGDYTQVAWNIVPAAVTRWASITGLTAPAINPAEPVFPVHILPYLNINPKRIASLGDENEFTLSALNDSYVPFPQIAAVIDFAL